VAAAVIQGAAKEVSWVSRARSIDAAGRVQIADMVIGEVLPDSALRDLDLSTVESLALCWKQRLLTCSHPSDSATSRSPRRLLRWHDE